MPIRTSSQLLLTTLAISLCAVAITGCVQSAQRDLSASPSGSPSPSESSGSGGSPSPTLSTPIGEAVNVSCDTLVPLQVMYNFNPNFGLTAGFVPTPGSDAATIVKEKGIACSWKNQTSGDVITIAVAKLAAADLTNLKNGFVQTSNSVPTYGDEAYFKVDAGVGVAEVFSGSYWISASSVEFLEPGDPTDLINSAIAALK